VSELAQQVPVRRPDPEPEVTREVPQAATGVSLLETEGATDVVDEPVPGASVPAADEPGFEAVVYAPVSPSEDEAPGPPGPDPSADEKEPKPHTLRWLLTSILGAIALAVLLPLAVGALRLPGGARLTPAVVPRRHRPHRPHHVLEPGRLLGDGPGAGKRAAASSVRS
jgi:hypothetical protein